MQISNVVCVQAERRFVHPGSMSAVPAISIIIVNWNGRHLLGDCLQSLVRQQFRDFEIVLVDNGSTDDSLAFVRREFPSLRIVELETNLGFCAANNRGVDATRGQYILFLNNDTEVNPTMLGELHKVIQADPPEIGAWAVKMLRWDRRELIDNCGCGYSIFGAGYQLVSGELDGEAFSQAQVIFGPSGGAACYRRAVLDQIGLFDEDFFYSNEDLDLSFRAQLAGYRCRYVPSAIVYHRGSATSGATSDQTIYHIQRNSEWVFFKNMPAPLLRKCFLPHLLYSLAWIVYWMTKGKAAVVLRAKWDALRAWRAVREKRRGIQSWRRATLNDIDRLISKRRVPHLWHSTSLPDGHG